MSKITLQDFENRLRNEVSSYASENGLADSVNFLIWFLVTYFRIDDDAVRDFVCDHSNDKGVDGIFVDDETEEIFIFQSKYRESFAKTEGDSDLRQFVGSTKWFSPENIGKLDNSRASKTLKDIVQRLNIFPLIGEGYTVRSVFVTTGRFNSSAKDYMKVTDGEIDYWDNLRLFENFTFTGQDEFVRGSFVFHLDDKVIEYQHGDGPSSEAFIFTVKALDLLKLDGIVDKTLFAKNVRFGLGRTNVNKEIESTINKRDQHKRFLLFNNGITIIAERASLSSPSALEIENYSIVNGCQSTLALYENRSELTPDLRVMVKLIETGANDKLGEMITFFTNNQNPITASDLRSRDKIQMTLQKQFEREFGKRILYKIKPGEDDRDYEDVLENTFAAQLLYSFKLGNPHEAHLKNKIFTSHYHKIFDRRVDAFMIFFLYRLYQLIDKYVDQIKEPIVRTYKPARFLLLYLIGQIMNDDPAGKEFMNSPKKFVIQHEHKYEEAFSKLIQILIIELNLSIEEEKDEDEYIDYKNILRNSERTKKLSKTIIAGYQRSLIRHAEESLANLLVN